MSKTRIRKAFRTVDAGRSGWCAKHLTAMLEDKPVEAKAANKVIVLARNTA